MPKDDREVHKRLLAQIRADFERLRWDATPIRAQMLFKATNAEAEGVKGAPGFDTEDLVAMQGAGHRNVNWRRNEQGTPLFRDDPILDVHGKPITNSAGQAYDIVMPAFRQVSFYGNPVEKAIPDYGKLSAIAERAGRIISILDRHPTQQLLEGWLYSSPADIWWALLFELGFSGWHPLIAADKRLWIPAEEPNSFIPYDLEQLNQLASTGLNSLDRIPKNWLKRLPEAWVSQLDNVAATSFDAADLLLDQGGDELTAPPSQTQSDEDMTVATIRRRFAVALSFSGGRRPFVEPVANALKSAFGEHRVFYDRFHEAELATANSDLLLQRMYAEESDLVVVFICGQYKDRDWCGLEWRTIRDMIKKRFRANDLMFFRFDKESLDGLCEIDGYVDVSPESGRQPQDAANLITRRWSMER